MVSGINDALAIRDPTTRKVHVAPGKRKPRCYHMHGERFVFEGRLSVLLVFTLVLVNIQCAAFCAFEPCNGGGTSPTPSPSDVPPCHHHDAPDQQTPAQPCSHQIVAQADVAQPLVTPVRAANALVMDVPVLSAGAFPPLSGVELLASHALSPPGLTVLSPVVLRI
jgi:hypothetical protein